MHLDATLVIGMFAGKLTRLPGLVDENVEKRGNNPLA
jgi:uncharacterized transporter YbjL